MCILGHQTQVMRLGASTLTCWATSVPCPKSLVLFLRFQSVVEMEHHLCEMQFALLYIIMRDTSLGDGKQQGFGPQDLALAAFLQELSLCESRKPREMVWLEPRAGLDCWSEETYLKVSWPQTSGGQSGKCLQGLSWNCYQTWQVTTWIPSQVQPPILSKPIKETN